MRFLSHACIAVFLAAVASIAALWADGSSLDLHGSLRHAVAYRVPLHADGLEPVSARRAVTALDSDGDGIACRVHELAGLVLLECAADRARAIRESERVHS